MRILASRHHWLPRTRIEGLQRFAFIGDSNVFGQGVTASEAFPARTGALMNEATAMPVEAVNLGVNGYNIWNSWLSFKEMPQVYDGVVLTLCNNDAQLFGRTYAVDYRNADHVLWQESHPYRGALVDIFDEIAAGSREVPVLVCYCNLWAGRPFEEIAATMGALCEARRLPFVNLYTHLAERRIAPDTLIVSAADHHPSPLAHDAMARHLVQVLRRAGWLRPPSAAELGHVPDSIAAAAAAMVGQDDYPIDAALQWAEAALEGKRRLASRLDDAGAAGVQIDQVTSRLEAARHRWQRRARAAAAVDQLSGERGLAGALNHVEEEILRLDELAYAIDRGGWAHIAADLLKSVPDASGAASTGETSAIRSRAFAIRTALEQARMLQEPRDAWFDDDDASRYAAVLEDAKRLAALTLDRLKRFEAALGQVAARLVAGSRDDDARLVLSALANGSAAAAMERFERLHAALFAVLAPLPAADGTETAIEVSVRTNRIEGRHPCLVEVIGNYTSPTRLPMRESRYFLPDGEPKTLSMRLPLFYAGRLVLSLRLPPAVAGSIDADVTEVRLANTTGQRTIKREEFISDNLGRLLSPQVWLV